MRPGIIAAMLASALPGAALAAADLPAGPAGDIPVEEWRAMAGGHLVALLATDHMLKCRPKFPGKATMSDNHDANHVSICIPFAGGTGQRSLTRDNGMPEAAHDGSRPNIRQGESERIAQ